MCPRYLPSLFCRFLTSRTQEKYVQGLLGFAPRTCLYLGPAGGRLRTQPAVPSRLPCEGRAERASAALHQVSLAPHPALTSQLDTTKATALPLVMKPVPAFCVPTPFYFFCLVPVAPPCPALLSLQQAAPAALPTSPSKDWNPDPESCPWGEASII